CAPSRSCRALPPATRPRGMIWRARDVHGENANARHRPDPMSQRRAAEKLMHPQHSPASNGRKDLRCGTPDLEAILCEQLFTLARQAEQFAGVLPRYRERHWRRQLRAAWRLEKALASLAAAWGELADG